MRSIKYYGNPTPHDNGGKPLSPNARVKPYLKGKGNAPIMSAFEMTQLSQHPSDPYPISYDVVIG